MKKVKKIFSWVMAVVTVFIFVFGFSIFVSVLRARNGEIPSFLGYSVLQIKSGSMEPEYGVGSIIVVKKVSADDLNEGDVISFYSTDSSITGKVNTHRIIEKQRNLAGGRRFITKGDANTEPDRDPVSEIMIIGKVRYNWGTVSGSVVSVLRNPKIIFFLIVLPLIFITFGEAFNLVYMIAENNAAKKKDGSDGKPEDEKN